MYPKLDAAQAAALKTLRASFADAEAAGLLVAVRAVLPDQQALWDLREALDGLAEENEVTEVNVVPSYRTGT